jgi:translation initiation factor 4E
MASPSAHANVEHKMNEQVDLSTIPISPDGEKNGDSAVDDKLITVFHDKDNFNVKHPLQNKWTLWFTKPPSGKVCGF